MLDYLKLLVLNVSGDHSEFKQNNQQVYKSDTIYWIKPCCLWDDGLWNEGRICEIELILWRKVPEISGTSGHRKRGQRTCRSARCHRYRRLVNSTSFWKHFVRKKFWKVNKLIVLTFFGKSEMGSAVMWRQNNGRAYIIFFDAIGVY